jgi:predicted ATPase
VAERLLAAAAASGSDDLWVEAHLAYGAALFHEGLLKDARAHLERCVALYDPERHGGHAFLYGQDPCVAGLGFLGRTLVLLGHESEAASCIERGLRRAEAIDHPFTRTFALLNAAQLHELRGDFTALLPYAEQAMALATQHRFPFLLGAAVSMRGQALVAAGAYADGLRLITEGVHTWRATGASLSLAYYLGVIADARRVAGDREGGLALVAEALATAARTGELISETDLHRIHGELLASDPATEDQAPAAFERGIALAQRQGALLFARRAAASFRRYLSERGRIEEARTLIGAWAEV